MCVFHIYTHIHTYICIYTQANQSWYDVNDTLVYVTPSLEGSCMDDTGGKVGM